MARFLLVSRSLTPWYHMDGYRLGWSRGKIHSTGSKLHTLFLHATHTLLTLWSWHISHMGKYVTFIIVKSVDTWLLVWKYTSSILINKQSHFTHLSWCSILHRPHHGMSINMHHSSCSSPVNSNDSLYILYLILFMSM